MTSPFSAHIAALREFNENTDKLLLEQVKKVEPEIVDYVTEEQLFQGVRADGTEIEPEYTPFTVKIKLEKGQPVNRVTWKDTGTVYDSLRLEFFPKSFAVVGDDPKIPGLERKYGTKVLGLTVDGIDEVVEMIKEPFVEEFRNSLLG